MRNPRIVFHGTAIQFIGDTHLGKSFRRGAQKQGQREKMVLSALTAFLKEKKHDADYIIFVGDFFDSFRVSNETLASAREAFYKSILNTKSGIKVIILPGNHDYSKDNSKISSYAIFKRMMEKYDQVTMLADHRQPPVILNLEDFDLYLDPYSVTGNPHPMPENRRKDMPLLAVGHWEDIRGNGYIPSDELMQEAELIVSGHIHTPMRTGKVIYTGSFQPYSHGEDPDEEFYITVQYDELEQMVKDPVTAETLELKHVRCVCKPGYHFDKPIKCLSLTYNPILTDDSKPVPSIEDVADFNTLFLYHLKMVGVDDEVLLKLDKFMKDPEEGLSL